MPSRMVHTRKSHSYTSPTDLNSRIPEAERFGMVLASSSVPHDCIHIFLPCDSRFGTPISSIVICTYGRQESLDDTLQSLSKQTYRSFEVILLSEKGNLSEIRQKGLRLARGYYVSFIDDDVYCPSTWLQSVVHAIQKEGVVGVSGPTTITEEYKKNRDCIKYNTIRSFHDKLFKVLPAPGTLSICGTPSMASNDEGCSYEGQVAYLECCNMSVKREEALSVGGFESIYIRTSEWCEVDLSLKLNSKGKLVFVSACKLYHRPSQAGIYKARIQTYHRWQNFVTFQKRWIKVTFRRHLYWIFVWTYLKMKEMRII